MSTRKRRNRKTAKQGFGNAGELKSNAAGDTNAEVVDGAFFSGDWKSVVLPLLSNTIIVTVISYAVFYLATKAEAVHDGFSTSWVQISPSDPMRLIPSLI